ncbi:MAG: VanZ family protein [Myxococcota bacterium]|nr:VanZ family protein [Myxococcota bacterium]
MGRFVRFGLPPIAVAALIFALSSRSSLPGPGVVGLDKVAHAVAYATLAWLTARGLFGYRVERLTAAVLGALLATLYGVSDEWHQSFVPGRMTDPADLVADALGASVAAFAWFRFRHRW